MTPADAAATDLDDFGLLDPALGALEAPIRAVLFGPARFEQHGRSLAQTHEVVRRGRARTDFFPRLADNVAVLQQARLYLERHAGEGRQLGPAAHWLLDNAALLDEQLGTIRRGLPRGFFHVLPRLRDEPLAGLPRIYGVAWAWVAHTDSGLDLELLDAYLRAYQAQRELTLGELWALPTTMRVVLVENLRRLAERVAAQQAAREAAHQWLDRADGTRMLAQLDALEPRLVVRGVAVSFWLQLEQRADELPPDEARALDAWLATRLPDAAGALARQQAESTEDQQSIRNAITTLRLIDRADWRALFDATHPAMRRLAQSPVHAAEREDTQDRTLHAVERLARRSGLLESQVAEAIVALCERAPDATHPHAAPAWWWDGDGEPLLRAALGLPKRRLPRPRSAAFRRVATVAYLGTVVLATGAGTLAFVHGHAAPGASAFALVLATLLLLGPVGEAVVAVLNRLISESVRPARLPRLAWRDGIPEAHRVLVVMPSMLTSVRAVAALADQLEQHHLANPGGAAQFALLTDHADADAAHVPQDDGLLAAAVEAIDALNARHPVPDTAPRRFLLLHRERRWSDTEQRWIGWERKRGKLEQLLHHLVEPSVRPFVDLGATSRPAADVQHVLTLDADTDLPPGRLRDLVAVAAHPLNQPRLDAHARRVVAGHAVLQPRVETPLPAPAQSTPFHALFAGQCGLDPYSAASSEIYQDLFGEGTFTGKGLLHVRAVHAVLGGRLPEGQVLSHDLLEGSIARCAGVSDVVVVEDAPMHADVAASRVHRWTRGDWQLLPFLADPRRWGLGAIPCWKMADNLRRSLVAPAALMLVLLVLATGALPLVPTLLVVAAAFCAGPLLGAVAGLAPSRDDVALGLFYRHAVADVGRALALGLWHVVQLLELALLQLDAVVRAMWRQAVSRRRLLQWTTAAAAQAAVLTDLPGLLARHRRVPLAAIAIGFVLVMLDRLGAPVAAGPSTALLLVWGAAPVLTWAASRPRARRGEDRLDPSQREWLHALARDTWRYHERNVDALEHHLPPDNVQQVPHRIVAHRTSPTNIGLYLLTVACARELGWIGRAGMADRLQATLSTMARLPRHHGHFLNWYDTRTLQVLPPAYVSTVDSGNLCGHLLVLAQACEHAAREPAGPGAMPDALARLASRLRALHPVLAGAPTLRSLAELVVGGFDWPAEASQAQALAVRVDAAKHELDHLNLGASDRERDGPLWLLHDLVAMLGEALEDARRDPAQVTVQLRELAQQARAMALEADFAMLYDPKRKLLRIGLQADTGRLDEHHYDLLASEARLASLVAIAKGDVPVEHWAALGRPFFAQGAEVGLKSWSGSMFEYLMPSLVLDEPVGSVLHQAARSAVAQQREDGRRHGTPWGISESAIAAQDHTLAYQYGPQGVARLALRRTPAEERVIAPYASAMAVRVAPGAAVANLQALQAAGARRAMGFIEALDCTPSRVEAGQRWTPVETFMAHHQGMALLAFTDALADGVVGRWAATDPHLRAVASLLHERAPREVARLVDPPLALPPRRGRTVRQRVLDVDPMAEALPPTQLLSNGRHAVLVRSHGTGVSLWDGLALHRWRDDLPAETHGTLMHLRRDGDEAWTTVGARPAPDVRATYRCRLQPDRVVHEAHWPDLSARCTVWVSPEDDVELRELALESHLGRPLALSLAAVFEATLAPLRADEAHPAFSNLFVQARWDAAEQALYLTRRPRLPDEAPVHLVLCLAMHDGPPGAVEPALPVADRARWVGRYRTPAHPAGRLGADPWPATAADPSPGTGTGAPLPGVALDTGLDPLAAVGCRVVLAPAATLKLVWMTGVSRDLEVLGALVDKYRQASHVERASNMAYTMAAIRLRELQFDPDTWSAMLRVQTLLTALPSRDLPSPPRGGHALRCDRRLLWRHGLSGDRPIVLVTIAGEEGLGLVLHLKRALAAWSPAGLAVDVVVVNAEPASYNAPVRHQLQLLHERHLAQQDEHLPAHRRGGLHLLREQDLTADERWTLQGLARVRLQADGRPLALQIERLVDEHRRARAQRDAVPVRPVPALWPAPQRPHVGASRLTPSGFESSSPVRAHGRTQPEGRFEAGGREFRFVVEPAQHPSRPWINVLANPTFGTQVSEVAGTWTWAGNSRQHQVTAWSNDPLVDPPSEQVLLHDLASGEVWPLGRRLDEAAPIEVVQALGWTRARQRIGDLDVTLTWCVDPDRAVKQLQVRLQWSAGAQAPLRPRRLRLVANADWQLGASRAERLTVVTQAERHVPGSVGVGLPQPEEVLSLHATQLDHLGGFGGATAFLAWRPAQADDASAEAGRTSSNAALRVDPEDWTCDRRELHDAAGRAVLPLRLGRRQGAGLDPCAALTLRVDLQPGQVAEASVLLGHAPDADAARALLAEAWAEAPAQRLARQRAQWPVLLGGVQVQTPDPRFDALVNHWLPYQTVVCRLWARAGFYQAGGAFGFRDQLQDAMALAGTAPQLLAAQLRRHAARQFPEGDVQHWWHEPGGAGVRTRFSDDLLWLPLALAHHVRCTGDASLLDETAPFLHGRSVPDGAEDVYEAPSVSAEHATLYEHAARAVDARLGVGAHGLPWFGTGDWNDGMNRVGHEGRGESVWLAWFLCCVVDDLLPIAEARGDRPRVEAWQAARVRWVQALDDAGWDGAWYRRGFFDDGSPLGSVANGEARIDLIAQAWAVLSGAGDPARARRAMGEAWRRLVDRDHHLLRLLDPPLQHQRPSAGYIQAYPPGVRENGGQYNHAGVWGLMAWARLGDAERAWQAWTMLSPAHRAAEGARAEVYALEPYVMAGDVYTQPPYAGRGGWSWYTGSAGWMLRAGVESLLGVVVQAGRVTVRPCLPPHWREATVTLRSAGGRRHHVVLVADAAARAAVLARHVGAAALAVGGSFDVADQVDGSVHVVDTSLPQPVGAGAASEAA